MSSASPSELLESLRHSRDRLSSLVALATDEELCTAYHADFSPIGWHLGHVAAFEAFWVHEHTYGESMLSERWRRAFDPRSNPKPERGSLPSREELESFAARVRARTIERVREAPHWVYGFVLAHEQQHTETIATVLRMRPAPRREASGCALPRDAPFTRAPPLEIPAGSFVMGEDDRSTGYDNERGAHEVLLPAFRIDAAPVTNGEFLAFIEEQGYERRELWSEAGWQFARELAERHPATWRRSSEGWRLAAFGGDVVLPLGHPVEGVSFFEAEAVARFFRARLPTEAEWERAARLFPDENPHVDFPEFGTRVAGAGRDFLGNVWEWTSSPFAPYPKFEPFPYEGYSQPYYDGRHRVLRGGSWATQGRIARNAFRNWYEPHWRHMFAGLRLVRAG